jgi:hypothetical protein
LAAVPASAGCAGGAGQAGIAPGVPQAAARAAAHASTSIELDAASSGPVVSADAYGANIDTWFDFTQAFVNPSLRATGVHLVRFPGGSESDAYHWENGGTLCDNQGYITANGTFDDVIRRVTSPLHQDVAITLNYGSNRTCNGGGDPSEAAAWVAYARSKGYNVPFWTVGNEVYGSWEYDLHTPAHDPTTYANAVRTGYYPLVKKANPESKLGVVVDVPSDTAWNDVVLRDAAPFDFVEMHYYPEYVKDDDAFLLGPAVDTFASDLQQLREQMTRAGVGASTPIYLGEYNADAGTEGKQSVSIVNGLFLGQMLGTLLDAGVPRATWWLANGSCDVAGGDYSKSLYGWQHFGSEALLSDGLPDSYEGCADTPQIPGGTPFPTARVMALFAAAIPAGSTVRRVSVSPSADAVRAYGFALAKGAYAYAIFNNTLEAVTVSTRIQHAVRTQFDATVTVYGADQYDRSRENQWIGPVAKSLGTVGTTLQLGLPRYSVSVLTLQ